MQFRNLLTDLSGERIVILSTHIVPDVEATATEIVLINKGKLIYNSKPEELLKAVEDKIWNCVIPSEDLINFRQSHLISSTIRKSDGIHVRVVSDLQPVDSATKLSATLEDAYLYYISNSNLSVECDKV